MQLAADVALKSIWSGER